MQVQVGEEDPTALLGRQRARIVNNDLSSKLSLQDIVGRGRCRPNSPLSRCFRWSLVLSAAQSIRRAFHGDGANSAPGPTKPRNTTSNSWPLSGSPLVFITASPCCLCERLLVIFSWQTLNTRIRRFLSTFRAYSSTRWNLVMPSLYDVACFGVGVQGWKHSHGICQNFFSIYVVCIMLARRISEAAFACTCTLFLGVLFLRFR